MRGKPSSLMYMTGQQFADMRSSAGLRFAAKEQRHASFRGLVSCVTCATIIAVVTRQFPRRDV